MSDENSKLRQQLVEARLEEARRRYDEEGTAHDQVQAEVRIWLTLAALVLGVLGGIAPEVLRGLPEDWTESFRLLTAIVAFCLWWLAGYYLRDFFFGRDFTRLGCAEKWHDFAKSRENESLADARVDYLDKLADAYAKAAAKRATENKDFTDAKLQAKSWIVWALVMVIFCVMFHACAQGGLHG